MPADNFLPPAAARAVKADAYVFVMQALNSIWGNASTAFLGAVRPLPSIP